MEKLKLGEMEGKFANLIWEKAPISTSELIKLCAEAFEWKRTTTYTMLKRLCQRGIFENNKGTVVIKIEKIDYHAEQSQAFLEETYEGSLPKFIAAFAKQRKLSEEEINEIQDLIDAHKEG